MSDSTIAQLPSALSLTGAEYFPVDQSGVTKKATLSMLGNGSVFITAGKSLYVTNTLTFTGTDGTTITFPTTNATVARTDAGQTFTGTQIFGALTCTTINGGTIAFVAGKTFTANNSITIAGTDGTTITFPTTSATIARTDAAQTFTGTQTFSSPIAGSVTGSAATLTTARTIDGVSFDGSANILVVAPAIHAATNKATPVDADEFGIWDSVGSALNHVTWANIKATSKTYFDTLYPPISEVALIQSVTAVAAPDLFGASAATINYDNSTPVTMTSIAACTANQVGSVLRLIPNADTSITASANLIVDGATSGTTTLGADEIAMVVPLTTSQFKVTSAASVAYSGAATATTSGTYVDFTSIPAGKEKITIALAGVSTSGTSPVLLQIGDSGGIETSGYTTASGLVYGAGANLYGGVTSGFPITYATHTAANTLEGSVTFSLVDSSTNTWAVSGNIFLTNQAYIIIVAGSKSLTATLDRIRLTTVGGTDTFDAGTARIFAS